MGKIARRDSVNRYYFITFFFARLAAGESGTVVASAAWGAGFGDSKN